MHVTLGASSDDDALHRIDNHTKDGGAGRSDFCVVFTMNLCALELK